MPQPVLSRFGRRLGNTRQILSLAADKIRSCPLKSPEAGFGNKTLGRDLLKAVQFFHDQALLLGRSLCLALIALCPSQCLRRVLLKDPGLGRKHRRAGLELRGLEAHGLLRLPTVLPIELRKFGGPANCSCAKLFSLEPSPLRLEGDQLRGERPFLCSDFCRSQFDQQLALPYALSLLDVDRADKAAIAMLHRLPLTRNGEAARGVGCSIKMRKGRPAKEEDEEKRCDT
ncbi:MAG TPA: hypothetical protein VJM81_00020 [Rhizorhapis sp.]|nr:hypothetical protein [Rhizorhapis sp.]